MVHAAWAAPLLSRHRLSQHRQQRDRVRRGVWENPAKLNPPTGEEQAQRARLGRQREVAAGTWRNPALSAEARRKLSRPRKHHGILHRVMEKLKHGSVADLTEAEKRAHRKYRRLMSLRKRA